MPTQPKGPGGATPLGGEPAPDAPPPEIRDRAVRAAIHRYWAANKRILAILLLLWALAGPGCGILFADALNGIQLGGFKLGFWFAQQGSIVVFVLLILIYAILLNRLDRRHHQELGEIAREHDRELAVERQRVARAADLPTDRDGEGTP